MKIQEFDLLLHRPDGMLLSIDADKHDILIPFSGGARTITVVDSLGQTWKLQRVEGKEAPFWDLFDSPDL